MKAQGVFTSLGTLLTRVLSAREREFAHETLRRMANEDSQKKSRGNEAPRRKWGDAPTMPEVVIRGAEDTVKAQSGQPAMVNPGPMLALMMMLRNRRPRSRRNHGRELSLPSGCVLAVRYASR